MTFRTRLFGALTVAALVPLLAFGIGVRFGVTRIVTEQDRARVDALVGVIEDDVARARTRLADQLATLGESMTEDNRLRAGLLGNGDRSYVVGYAERAMRLAGLDVLQLQDDRGRILSSGHFRGEFDRLEAWLPARLAAAGAGMAEARSPEGPFPALVRVDSVTFGGRRFYLVGGIRINALVDRLPRDVDLQVAVRLEDSRREIDEGVVARVPIPHVAEDAAPDARAYFVVFQSTAPLAALQRQILLWLIGAIGGAAAIGLLLGAWYSARIGRPLAELADKTSRVDLDRLDVDFSTTRADEVGALSRLLGAMTARLKGSAARLRQMERRASMGDLARQVNHDIKNGLAPIRNVLRHFGEVAEREPDQLAAIFAERKGTLESSVTYLEELARNYARLSPKSSEAQCDVNAAVREAIAGLHVPDGVPLDVRLTSTPAIVNGDAVVLRRVVENLTGNAIDSLDGPHGSVAVETQVDHATSPVTVRIVVADTGRGMSEEELERAFGDFYTTKTTGTGLGLSIVRRLVLDLKGQMRVETAPGEGSRFIIDLPGASAPGRGDTVS